MSSAISSITSPIRHLTDAVVMPVKALFVVGLCAAINAMTYSGTWWFKWVALGMGIAVVVALARAAKTLLVLGLVAWVGMKVHQRYGQQARAQFDTWAAEQQPQATELFQRLRAWWPNRAV